MNIFRKKSKKNLKPASNSTTNKAKKGKEEDNENNVNEDGDKTVQALVGDRLWIPNTNQDFSYLWSSFEVASVAADKKKVFLLDQFTKRIFEIDVNKTMTYPYDRCHGQDFDDLTRMNYLHEASMLNTLCERYMKDKIYTFFGDTLISINPYHEISGLYSKKVDAYEPHVFTVAERAFDLLQKKRTSHSIVINGDSGAGKTEAAKQIMRHLVKLSLDNNPDAVEGTTPEVENLVLESTPVLEAFGNSITLRNDNSSRFGRFIQILYDSKFNIAGMTTLHFLLEKSRLISRSPGERNYHIFYQVCAGLEKEPSSFRFLQPELNGANYQGLIPDDKANFERTKRSLLTIGIDSDVQDAIFKVVMGFLNLGNVDFVQDENDPNNTGKCKLLESSRSFLDEFSRQLMIPEERFPDVEFSMLKRNLVVGNETTEIHLNMAQAKDSRDGLAKFIYSKLFDWIVSELNEKSKKEKSSIAKNRFIGVLDIFGFEDLEKNSFEQLCVNYANELLQKQFDLHVVESERKLFKEEGVEFPDIQLPSLIASEKVLSELKTVVFASLEEQCLLRSGTDVAFVGNLVKEKQRNQKIELDWKIELGFIVKHFAGEVSYDGTGFLDKNRDALNDDLKKILLCSENEIIKHLMAGEGDRERRTMAEKETVLKKFLGDMNNLISTLSATDNSFVRCIKPNSMQSEKEFDVRQIKSQLEYLGILQAIRVHQETYPVRREFEFIPDNYDKLVKDEDREEYEKLALKDKIRKILNEALGEGSEFKLWQLGFSKIFLGDEVLYKLDALLNKLREERLGRMDEKERELELEKERLKQEEELKRAREKLESEQKAKLAEEREILRKEEERLKRLLAEREEKMKREEEERNELLKKREEELLTQEQRLSELERENAEKLKLKEEEIRKQKEQEEAIMSQQKEKLAKLEEQEKLKQMEIEKLNEMQADRVKALEQQKQELLEREEALEKKHLERENLYKQQQKEIELLRENKEKEISLKEKELSDKEKEMKEKALKEEEERQKRLKVEDDEKKSRLANVKLGKDKELDLREKELELEHMSKEQQLQRKKLELLAQKEELDRREREFATRAQRMNDKNSTDVKALQERARRKAKLKRRKAKLYAILRFQTVVRKFLMKRNYDELKEKTRQYREILNQGEFVVMSSIVLNSAPVNKTSKLKRRVMLLTTQRRVMIVDPISLKVDQEGYFEPGICKISARNMRELDMYLFTDKSKLVQTDWRIRDLVNDASIWLGIFDTLSPGGDYVKKGFGGVLGKRVSKKGIIIPLKIGELRIINDESMSKTSSRRSIFGMRTKKDLNRMQFYHLKNDKWHGLQWYEDEKDEMCAGTLGLDKKVRVLIPDTSNVHGKLSTFVFCLKVIKGKKEKLYTLQAGGLEDRKSWIISLRKPIVRDGFRRANKLPKEAKSSDKEEITFMPTFLSGGNDRPHSLKVSKSTKDLPKVETGSMRGSQNGRSSNGTLRKGKSVKRVGRSRSFRDNVKKSQFQADDFMSAFDDTDVQTNSHIKSFAKKT